MPLTDVTHGERLVDPARAEQDPWVSAIARRKHARTFNKMIRIMDNAIQSVVDSGHNSGNLIWTKAGVLFGHGSGQVHGDVNYLWDEIIQVTGNGRECLFALGTMLKWRFSLRSEDWLVYKRLDDNHFDEVTGDPIRVAEYWIRGTKREED